MEELLCDNMPSHGIKLWWTKDEMLLIFDSKQKIETEKSFTIEMNKIYSIEGKQAIDSAHKMR